MAQDFYTPLALKAVKGQHLPALVVYKNQSLTKDFFGTIAPEALHALSQELLGFWGDLTRARLLESQ